MLNFHPYVLLEHKSIGIVRVDEFVAPVVLALWDRDIITMSSCQGEPGKSMGYIFGFGRGMNRAERVLRSLGLNVTESEIYRDDEWVIWFEALTAKVDTQSREDG